MFDRYANIELNTNGKENQGNRMNLSGNREKERDTHQEQQQQQQFHQLFLQL